MAGESTTAWSVVSQTEGQGRDRTGAYVPGVYVTFQLAGGVTGSVFVPNSEYTLEAVQRAIAERAAIMAGVAGLQG